MKKSSYWAICQIIFLAAVMSSQAFADVDKGKRFLWEKNYEAAYPEFYDVAVLGDMDAQFYLGVMYERGRGVAQDYQQALYWYRKAADQGSPIAQNYLGDMYENGQGVAQDYQKALYWYRKSADQDEKVGQFSLGSMYENGFGVAQDYQQAIYWYRKAADGEEGIPEAQASFMDLEFKMAAQPKPPAIPPTAITPPSSSSPVRPSGTLYVLAVGVQNFTDPSLQTLSYSADDAVSLVDVFKKQKGRVFTDVKTYLRTEQQATRKNVLSDMQAIQNLAQPGDTVIAFFSTHGQNAGREYYLYTSETQSDNLSTTGLKGADIVAFYTGVKANTLLLLDSCFSGALSPDGKSAGDSTNGAFVEQVSRSGGIESAAPYVKTVISSASGAQKSWECKLTGHGCFTAAFLDGLTGKAGTGGVSVNMLSGYVTDTLPGLLKAEKNPALQRPNIKGDVPTWIISLP